MIGIIGAMQIEIEALAGRVENARRERFSSIEYIAGTLSGQEVVLAQCGVGKVNAAVCAQTMALRYRPDWICNTGVAGAIDPRLRVGDIVVGRDVVQHDVDTSPLGDPVGMVSTVNVREFPLDAEIGERILRAGEALNRTRGAGAREEKIQLLPGRIASGDQFVGSSERKKAIREVFQGDCCEMEAGAIAQVCYLNQIPCAVIRSISDGGDESAAMSYAEFLPIAARNSAELVLELLRQPRTEPHTRWRMHFRHPQPAKTSN